jgi:hypothetical protein
MNTVLLAACIAGFVSLLGLFANLWIARHTAKAQRSLALFQESLTSYRETDMAITGFLQNVEGLRIACWDIISECRTLKRQKGDARPTAALEAAFDALASQLDQTNQSWTAVKAQTLGTGLEAIRRARHNCRRQIDLVQSHWYRNRSQRPSQATQEVLIAIEEDGDVLLRMLDYLMELVTVKRREVLLNTNAQTDGG